jgi:hypothetical protein
LRTKFFGERLQAVGAPGGGDDAVPLADKSTRNSGTETGAGTRYKYDHEEFRIDRRQVNRLILAEKAGKSRLSSLLKGPVSSRISTLSASLDRIYRASLPVRQASDPSARAACKIGRPHPASVDWFPRTLKSLCHCRFGSLYPQSVSDYSTFVVPMGAS